MLTSRRLPTPPRIAHLRQRHLEQSNHACCVSVETAFDPRSSNRQYPPCTGLDIVPAPELVVNRATSTVPLELSVLPTLRTAILRTQVSRLLATPVPKSKFRLVASLSPAEGSEERVQVDIPPTEENKEVSWWGLRDGDAVQIVPS